MATVKLSTLTDTEKAVVQAMTMRLNPREALEYLRETGFDISESTYFRYKKKIQALKWERVVQAANMFTEQHLQRIDKLELVEQLMWRHYQEEPQPYRKVKILESIVNIQPYISRYYGATTLVLQRRLKTDLIAAKQETPIYAENKFNDVEEKELRDMTNQSV